jgi:hypothetical protein
MTGVSVRQERCRDTWLDEVWCSRDGLVSSIRAGNERRRLDRPNTTAQASLESSASASNRVSCANHSAFTIVHLGAQRPGIFGSSLCALDRTRSPVHGGTTPPLTTPPAMPNDADMSLSPASVDSALDTPDALVAQTAQKIADVINDFKRELNKRDGTSANTTGAIELLLPSQTFELVIAPHELGAKYPITVQANLKSSNAANSDSSASRPSNAPRPIFKHTRRASDAELERDIVSRKKRKLDEGDDDSNKRARTEEDDEDVMPLITKEDLDDLLVKLREDIQEDTSECVNHVQRLLRRFKEEWHEKSQWEYEHSQTKHPKGLLQASVAANGATPGASFPAPSADAEDPNSSIVDVVRRESKLISSQIKWVEECRRLAGEAHDQKTNLWRTSSAGFHDRQRQDREAFQARMLQESTTHAQTLHQILNEVKAIGLYAQAMKWETPNSHLAYYPQAVAAPPAFPTQPAPTAPGAAGRGRGQTQTPARQINQR